MSQQFMNPFASRSLRPGVVPFRYADGIEDTVLLDRIRKYRGVCQFVGPHGSGKSTLIRHLLPRLREAYICHIARLTSSDRLLPWSWSMLARLARQNRARPRVQDAEHDLSIALLVIDGFEQLSSWRRWWLIRFARLQGMGLLVTCHVDCGLSTAYETRVDFQTARHVVDWLVLAAAMDTDSVSDHSLDELLTKHHGNLREVLFELYDEFSISQRC